MRETEIAAYILQHDARNLRLKRRLAERGIDGRAEYLVTCRFSAPSRQQASELAKELQGKGFASVEVAAAPVSRMGGFWRVTAHGRQALEGSASHEFTEQMVRLAAARDGFYDGWEARIPAAGAT